MGIIMRETYLYGMYALTLAYVCSSKLNAAKVAELSSRQHIIAHAHGIVARARA